MNSKFEFGIVLFGVSLSIGLATILWSVMTMVSLALEHAIG